MAMRIDWAFYDIMPLYLGMTGFDGGGQNRTASREAPSS